MYRNQSRNNSSSSLHDIVFLMASGFFILFMVALWYVNPVAKLGKIDDKAEFIITVTWPGDLDVDVDTWVMDPNGILVWYQSKSPNGTPVLLDRDDLGHSNDTFWVDGKIITLRENIENVSIRAILPGEYIVNLHYFNNSKDPGPVPVTVKVEKLNPTVKKVFITVEPVILNYKGDEITVVRFIVDVDGTVSNVSTGPQISLIQARRENRRAPFRPGIRGN